MTLEVHDYQGDPKHGPTRKVRLVACPFCEEDLREKTPPVHLRTCPDAPREVGR